MRSTLVGGLVGSHLETENWNKTIKVGESAVKMPEIFFEPNNKRIPM